MRFATEQSARRDTCDSRELALNFFLPMPDVKVPIREFYSDYQPPRYFRSTVATLLKGVPEKYLQGLDCVVLTNQSGKSRQHRTGKITSRKRRIKQWGCLGLYHHGNRNGQAPWIEIFVDHIAAQAHESWINLLPIARYSMIGMVLYHEVGHHVHRTKRPEFREPEDVADQWSKTLLRQFLRRRYWYVRPVLRPIGKLCDLIVRGYSKRSSNNDRNSHLAAPRVK